MGTRISKVGLAILHLVFLTACLFPYNLQKEFPVRFSEGERFFNEPMVYRKLINGEEAIRILYPDGVFFGSTHVSKSYKYLALDGGEYTFDEKFEESTIFEFGYWGLYTIHADTLKVFSPIFIQGGWYDLKVHERKLLGDSVLLDLSSWNPRMDGKNGETGRRFYPDSEENRMRRVVVKNVPPHDNAYIWKRFPWLRAEKKRL